MAARPPDQPESVSFSYLDESYDLPDRLPLIPLRDVVLFPHMVFPLLVGRPASLEAVEQARRRAEEQGPDGVPLIALAAQSVAEVDLPGAEDLYDVGVVGRMLQVVRLPSGMLKVVVEGLHRVHLHRISLSPEGPYAASLRLMPDDPSSGPRTEALTRSVLRHFEEYVDVHRQIPEEIVAGVKAEDEDPSRLADLVAGHLNAPIPERQRLLTLAHVQQRLSAVLDLLVAETEIVRLERSIEGEVHSRMQNNQREYYLQEQMRVIREELGEEDEWAEIDQLREAIKKAGLPREAREKAEGELEKLARMHALSPEATVVRNYLDWLITLPWKKRTRDRLDLREVRRILDEDHHGLEKAKERVLEYLAVIKLVGSIKGPILCLVGPPGTGKTSVARSVARSLGRKFVRMSLGGVRDEAEIRGHRRTYIGALPGRILQSMKKGGTRNPVFLLDEVDKMSSDFRGDPAAALLEVLDPEQNGTFIDHYLEVEYDLSDVLFITTANTLYPLPDALRDRMEVIEMPGYLDPDKLAIGRDFLVPKQRERHGLSADDLRLSDQALRKIISGWTREAGVRGLERSLATICRKVARQIAEQIDNGRKRSVRPVRISPGKIERYLGVPPFEGSLVEKEDLVGAAQGLAWTSTGGDLLKIEVALVPGRGRLQLTGKLGDVMQESARAAVTYARAHARQGGYDPSFYRTTDIHIHIPEGAIPKDGPSAGITIATALISALTGRPVRRQVAMTGEITLRGHVLAVGGLSEKVMAARRGGVTTVIIPRDNARHLKELPRGIARGLNFVPVVRMHEVLVEALQPATGQVPVAPPEPAPADEPPAGEKAPSSRRQPRGRGRAPAPPRDPALPPDPRGLREG